MDTEVKTQKWTYDAPVTTHNWPTLTWESVVRDASRKPVAIALGSNEKEPLDRALLFCKAPEMVDLLRRWTKHETVEEFMALRTDTEALLSTLEKI